MPVSPAVAFHTGVSSSSKLSWIPSRWCSYRCAHAYICVGKASRWTDRCASKRLQLYWQSRRRNTRGARERETESKKKKRETKFRIKKKEVSCAIKESGSYSGKRKKDEEIKPESAWLPDPFRFQLSFSSSANCWKESRRQIRFSH